MNTPNKKQLAIFEKVRRGDVLDSEERDSLWTFCGLMFAESRNEEVAEAKLHDMLGNGFGIDELPFYAVYVQLLPTPDRIAKLLSLLSSKFETAADTTAKTSDRLEAIEFLEMAWNFLDMDPENEVIRAIDNAVASMLAVAKRLMDDEAMTEQARRLDELAS